MKENEEHEQVPKAEEKVAECSEFAKTDEEVAVVEEIGELDLNQHDTASSLEVPNFFLMPSSIALKNAPHH